MPWFYGLLMNVIFDDYVLCPFHKIVFELITLAYLGAYGAHMFALRVWVKNSPLGQSVSICLFVPLFDPLPIKLFQI